MTAHRTQSSRRHPNGPDIITYRLNGQMMYVPLTNDFSKALENARKAFHQLREVEDRRISLSLTVVSGDQRHLVGITPIAWSKVVQHLARYEIIDIHITPKLIVTSPDEPAPPYMDCSDLSEYSEKPHYHDQQSRHSPPPSPTLGNIRMSPRRLLQKLTGI